MARLNDRYSMNRRDKKLAGVCSTIGEVFNLDPTFIRIGFVAAAILVSWKLALVAYVGAGIYLAIQRKEANRSVDRSRTSEYDRMEDVTRVRPTTHALRTQLDDTDAAVAIGPHNSTKMSARRDRRACGRIVMNRDDWTGGRRPLLRDTAQAWKRSREACWLSSALRTHPYSAADLPPQATHRNADLRDGPQSEGSLQLSI